MIQGKESLYAVEDWEEFCGESTTNNDVEKALETIGGNIDVEDGLITILQGGRIQRRIGRRRQ